MYVSDCNCHGRADSSATELNLTMTGFVTLVCRSLWSILPFNFERCRGLRNCSHPPLLIVTTGSWVVCKKTRPAVSGRVFSYNHHVQSLYDTHKHSNLHITQIFAFLCQHRVAAFRQSGYKITRRGSKIITGRADILSVAHSLAHGLRKRGHGLGPKRSFFREIDHIVPPPRSIGSVA